jgi:hypothetical protein
MKKILIYLLCISAVLSGCDRKSDLNIDGKSTDQRLSEALAAYQKKLTDAPYGWVLTETTTGTAINGGVTQDAPKAVFSYYMKFNKDNQVSMIADFTLPTSVNFNTASYTIKATQRPTLVFDTYSYVHLPCDPDPTISNSPLGGGFGWGTDFEFSFADNVAAAELGDTIHLTGNLNSASAVLVKATQEEQNIFTNSGFGAYATFNKILTYFKRVNSGAETFEITPGIGGRSLNIRYAGHTDPINVACQFTAHSILLESPVTIGSQTISSFKNLVWNVGTKTISASINGTTPATISAALDPLAPEADIAENFYFEGADNPWLAQAGFHVNGIDDAYNMLKISYPGGNYLRFVFYPFGVGVGGGNYMDIVSPYFTGLSGSPYPYLGAGGISNTFLDEDRLVLDMLDFGTPVVNPPDLLATLDICANGKVAPPYGPSRGFYIVRKEDGESYDMVTAGDGLGWITWSHR